MNGFSTVEKLKELEQRATPGDWYAGVHPDNCDRCDGCDQEDPLCDNPIRPDAVNVIDSDVVYSLYANAYRNRQTENCELVSGLRNAAPLLLDIAGLIRPEDVKVFEVLIALYKGIGCSDSSVAIDVLKRYQRMAERMHETDV